MRVAVIGLGTVGTQAAFQLSKAGADVVGYEQLGLGHGFGSAGGDSRLYSRVELMDSRYQEVIARAEELWLESNRLNRARLLHLTGAVLMGDPEEESTRATFDFCAASADVHRLSLRELVDGFPQLRVPANEVAIFDPHAGRIDPELSIAMTGKLAAAVGGAPIFIDRP